MAGIDHDPQTCPRAVALGVQVGNCDSSISRIEADNGKQWDEINWIKKALTKLVPIWVTVVMMAMSGITGAALTYASLIVRFSGK